MKFVPIAAEKPHRLNIFVNEICRRPAVLLCIASFVNAVFRNVTHLPRLIVLICLLASIAAGKMTNGRIWDLMNYERRTILVEQEESKCSLHRWCHWYCRCQIGQRGSLCLNRYSRMLDRLAKTMFDGFGKLIPIGNIHYAGLTTGDVWRESYFVVFVFKLESPLRKLRIFQCIIRCFVQSGLTSFRWP